MIEILIIPLESDKSRKKTLKEKICANFIFFKYKTEANFKNLRRQKHFKR